MDGAGYVYKHKSAALRLHHRRLCRHGAKAAAMALLGQGQLRAFHRHAPGVTIEAKSGYNNKRNLRPLRREKGRRGRTRRDGRHAGVRHRGKNANARRYLDGGRRGPRHQAGPGPAGGAAAINRVPRDMIRREARRCANAGYTGGLRVTISVPGGEQVAKKTLQSPWRRGGHLHPGTSGIVEPMSEQALADSVRLLLSASGDGGAGGAGAGNYARLRESAFPATRAIVVKCSNFVGKRWTTRRPGLRALLLVGHLASCEAGGGRHEPAFSLRDARLELMAAHAAAAGAPRDTVAALLQCVTAEEGRRCSSGKPARSHHGALMDASNSMCSSGRERASDGGNRVRQCGGRLGKRRRPALVAAMTEEL